MTAHEDSAGLRVLFHGFCHAFLDKEKKDKGKLSQSSRLTLPGLTGKCRDIKEDIIQHKFKTQAKGSEIKNGEKTCRQDVVVVLLFQGCIF